MLQEIELRFEAVMFENRLRDYFTPSTGVVLTATQTHSGFVPYPCSMLVGYSMHQLALIAEIYRIAQAMTETQLRQTERPFPPAFSVN